MISAQPKKRCSASGVKPASFQAASKAAQLLVRLIKLARPLLGPAVCRFSPSCTSYAHEALGTHGALKGARLIVRRLSKCHPFNPGGYDPVPPAS